MTNREFYQAIVEGATVTAELATFAAEQIEKLDKRNEKRAATPSKTAIANEPIKAKIVEFLTGRPLTPANIIAEGVEITTQKASALCRQLVETGTLVVEDIKVAKKGKVKGYALAPAPEGEEA